MKIRVLPIVFLLVPVVLAAALAWSDASARDESLARADASARDESLARTAASAHADADARPDTSAHADVLVRADALAQTDGPPRVDRILIEKGGRRLTLLSGDEVVQGFWIALGKAPAGPKRQEGDLRTPEGLYAIESRNPDSRYYRALRISYPNERDRAAASELGVDPGGDIMIHGLPERLAWMGKYHRLLDWTDGCIAVTNDEMDTIWALVEVGTPVEIRP